MAKPQAWQTEPERIDSNRVQFWVRGTMVSARIEKPAAQDMVRDGRAFVINGQAIGAIIDGEMCS